MLLCPVPRQVHVDAAQQATQVGLREPGQLLEARSGPGLTVAVDPGLCAPRPTPVTGPGLLSFTITLAVMSVECCVGL